MRLCYIIHIKEFETVFCGLHLSNRTLCTLAGLGQLCIVIASFLQHVYSWLYYSHVFYCRSSLGANATLMERFLGNDIVIFDYGLMNRVLGTTECIANYLDGGYMRCSWCVQHATALLVMLMSLHCFPTPVWLLWPALFMQSTYVLGMAILTMATAPKLLEALGGKLDQDTSIAFGAYFGGFILNWLFTFVLWHYYWGVEGKYGVGTVKKSQSGSLTINVPQERNRRTPTPVFV